MLHFIKENCKISIRSCQRTHILKPGPELRMTATFNVMYVPEQWLPLADDIFFFGATAPSGPGPPHSRGF